MNTSQMGHQIVLPVKTPAVRIDRTRVQPGLQVQMADVAQQVGHAGEAPRVCTALSLAFEDRSGGVPDWSVRAENR